MSDWRKVETPPRASGPYLVFMPTRDLELDQFSIQYWHYRDGWSNNYGITHWMPFEPPSDTKKARS